MLHLDTDDLGSYFTPHNFPGRRVAKGFLRALSLQSGEELSPGNVNKEGDIIWQSALHALAQYHLWSLLFLFFIDNKRRIRKYPSVGSCMAGW